MPPPNWPAAERRTPASSTQISSVPAHAANTTAIWLTRVPGSSIRQAKRASPLGHETVCLALCRDHAAQAAAPMPAGDRNTAGLCRVMSGLCFETQV